MLEINLCSFALNLDARRSTSGVPHDEQRSLKHLWLEEPTLPWGQLMIAEKICLPVFHTWNVNS